ncbi:MAG: gliding motility-associated C-terminal domain-containing protein, partial [Cyclobacteriaceae bacterium]|nr:gliding motility-associated C-terminal domain-containing protein [Cyclobacteriaceae bacterium HetDA_MAG_MS6]
MRKILVLTILLATAQSAMATHIRAGEIIARRIDNLQLTYEFTMIAYIDTESGIPFGGGTFNFGDGESITRNFNVTPPQVVGNNLARVTFTLVHTYQAPNSYLVSYEEDFRNAGISNMDNSVNTPFYTQTRIVIDPFFGVNNTPVLTVPPIDEGLISVSFLHNPGAFDPDGDSLAYYFTTPQQARDLDVFNYRELIAPEFYTNFAAGSEQGSPPSLSLDPANGNLTWDAPGDILPLSGSDCPEGVDNCAEYNVAFVVEEWRQVGEDWFRLGFVTRDMQIIITDGDNERPE